MKNRDHTWFLEQAAHYVEKLRETKVENEQLRAQMEALRESLQQAKKEILYLKKLSHRQQQYIGQLETKSGFSNQPKKETTIRTIDHLKIVNEDAC